MKTVPILVTTISVAVLLGAPLGAKERSETQQDNITVHFAEPENYTDFATSRMETRNEREALSKEFRQEIQTVADRYVPPGYHVELTFRDIDMAGEFEPQAGPDFDDVRIVRGIYPPSILAEYEITNEAGDIVARGQRRETDITFQNVVTYRTDHRLFYETELVSDLLRKITRSL